MKKTIYILTNILILFFGGFIVYMEFVTEQKQYFVLWLFFVIIVSFLFIYKVQHFKENTQKIYSIVIFVSLLISIFINIFIFMKTSYTPIKNKETDWNMEDTCDFFLPMESKELDIPVGYRGCFLSTVINRLIESKEIIMQNGLENDVRILEAVLGRRYESSPFAGIDKQGIDNYIEHYKPQKVKFSGQESDSVLYIVTGTVWNEEAEKIYIVLDQESNIWMIPGRLLNKEYKTAEKYKYEYECPSDIQTITYEYHYDPTMRLLMPEKNILNENNIRNFIYFLFIWFIGFIGLMPIWNRLSGAIVCFLSIPMGAMIEIIAVFISGGILGIHINAVSFIVSIMVLLAVIWGAYLIRGGKLCINRKMSFASCVAVGGILCLMIFFSIYHRVFLSYDSIMNIVIANRVVGLGDFKVNFSHLSSYSLFMPIINIGASLFGIRIFYLFIPILCLSSLGIIWLLLWKMLFDINIVYKTGMLICVFGAVVTVPMFYLNTFWLLNNLSVGMYYAVALILLFYGSKINKDVISYLSIPFFLIANTVRVEAPLFGAIVLLLLADYMSDRLIKSYAITLAVATVFIFAAHIMVGIDTAQTAFWSISKGIAVLLAVFVAVLYVFVLRKWKIWIKLNKWISMGNLLEIILLIGIAFLGTMKTDFLIQNINGLSTSLFSSGIYGMIWAIYLFSLSYQECKNKEIFLIRKIINTHFLTTFALMMCRITPAHTNYTDSACRMMLHVMPTLLIYYVLLIVDWYKVNNVNEVKAD